MRMPLDHLGINVPDMASVQKYYDALMPWSASNRKTRAEVHAAHEWARGWGDEVLHEPQTFPQYHPDYYAVFWADPHGFKLEACCFAPE